MLDVEKIEKIKKYIGPDGKLIIDDSLTETEKQDFEYINSLEVDLLMVINKDRSKPRKKISEEDEEPDDDSYSDSDSDIEDIDSNYLDVSTADILEDDNVSINDLEDLF